MSITNPDSAQRALERLKERDRLGGAAKLDDLEAAETREHIEAAEAPECVAIDVGGEMIPCDPLGVGERLRPQKKALKGQERNDPQLLLEATLTMIDTLVAASPPAYDQAFWDQRDDDTLRDAFAELAEASKAGNGQAK